MRINKDIPRPCLFLYPWETMEVGDSFLIPTAKVETGTVHQSARRYRKLHNPTFRITTRRDKRGKTRVWRVA